MRLIYRYNRKGGIVKYRMLRDEPLDQKYRRLVGNDPKVLADRIIWTYTKEGWPNSVSYFEQGKPTF